MIERFTGCCHIIVTTVAGTKYLQVIHGHCWIPYIGIVTVFTDIGGTDVVQALADRGGAIVTTHTAFGGRRVVKACG
jgi:hypothetical protein